MQVLVAGATGNTGQRLVRELHERGLNPVAMVRESSDTSGLPEGVAQRQADLTDLSDDITEGCDVVVFAAGSGGDTSAEMTDRVDRDGAKKLIDLSVANGVRRFVMLSSIGAGDPDPDHELGHYLQAKHEADEHLKATDLEYAILTPRARLPGGMSPNCLLMRRNRRNGSARCSIWKASADRGNAAPSLQPIRKGPCRVSGGGPFPIRRAAKSTKDMGQW